jgi:outer membrane protein insertion porin family
MRKPHHYIYILLAILLIHACKTVEYPINKPYVYKTKINIVGNYTNAEKKRLLEKLEKQIDDSLKTSRRRDTVLRFIPYSIKQYHAVDTNAITRTYDFFKATYIANGYFRGGVTSSKIDTFNNHPYKRLVTFTVQPYQNHKIDTVIYELVDSNLTQLTNAIRKESFLHKGDEYSQDLLDAERRRLVIYFRNNGYLKLNKDDIKVVADTINKALFKIPEDPIQQQLFLEQAANFNANPTTDITVRLKDKLPATKLKRYYIGNIAVHIDNINEDTIPLNTMPIDSAMTKLFFKNAFKNKLFNQNIALKKGALFSQELYDKTLNALNYLGTWQQVVINSVDSTLRNDTMDFTIYMLPYKKYFGERKIEGSYNQNNGTNNITANLLGINVSQSIKNRNLAREAILSNTTAIASAEFGQRSIVNTLLAGLNYSLSFPKFAPYFWNRLDTSKLKSKSALRKKVNSWLPHAINPRSFISLSANYSKRIKLFELADIGLSYGIQWRNKKNWNKQFIFPNIENKVLDQLDSLKRLIIRNPNLAFIYNDGLIISTKFNAIQTISTPFANNKYVQNRTLRFGIESSFPFIAKGFAKTFDNNLFSFAKGEVEFKISSTKPNSSAFRAYLGIGKSWNQSLTQNKHLPFFRQFIGGGPNSMRAWTIRSISSYSTRINSTDQRDYFGDIQAEVNYELRHPLFKFIGAPINGAVFVDMGNIWNWKAIDATAVPTNLSGVQRFYNDIGIGAGYGIRADFDYFLIRVDLGVKLKEPLDINNNGGYFTKEGNITKLSDIKLQIGINYPF